MKALKQWLYEKGIRRFDTDTAITNTVAQHYYEKNGFVREGVTRSFFQKSERKVVEFVNRAQDKQTPIRKAGMFYD